MSVSHLVQSLLWRGELSKRTALAKQHCIWKQLHCKHEREAWPLQGSLRYWQSALPSCTVLMLHMLTKDLQIVRKLKVSKSMMRQEAELAGAKASIPKQDVAGVCIYCDAGCSSKWPCSLWESKKGTKSASKEERSTAFTRLSGHEGKRQKRKGCWRFEGRSDVYGHGRYGACNGRSNSMVAWNQRTLINVNKWSRIWRCLKNGNSYTQERMRF